MSSHRFFALVAMVLLVCASVAVASTTQPDKKPAPKTVKSTVPANHTTRSSTAKKVTPAKVTTTKVRPQTQTPAKKVAAKATTPRVMPSKSSRNTAPRASSESVASKKVNVRSRKGSVRSASTQTTHSHGQQGIDPDRARTIQEALIRAKYMDGEPSGVWDQKTKDAFTRLQSDNGWQTKIVPDSRALIKLGLGPDHTNVLNPETSGITNAPPEGAAPPAAALQPGGGSAVNR